MSADTAHWSPAPEQPEFTYGRGRSPRMTYTPWHRSQNTELGATGHDAWYRRCTTHGCRIWAGPYRDVRDAKDDGMWHQHHAHDLPRVRR